MLALEVEAAAGSKNGAAGAAVRGERVHDNTYKTK